MQTTTRSHGTSRPQRQNGPNLKRKNCVFIGGIPPNLTEGRLMAYFLQYGSVKAVTLNKPKLGHKQNRGHEGFSHHDSEDEMSTLEEEHGRCGFVEFATPFAAQAVLAAKTHLIDGQRIDTRIAMTNNERKLYQKQIMSDKRKIFIGHLPKSIHKDFITDYFTKAVGPIEEVTLIHKQDKEHGLCFILFTEKGVGDRIAFQEFEILPGVKVTCEHALNPQQLHLRKQQTQSLENQIEDSRNSQSSNLSDYKVNVPESEDVSMVLNYPHPLRFAEEKDKSNYSEPKRSRLKTSSESFKESDSKNTPDPKKTRENSRKPSGQEPMKSRIALVEERRVPFEVGLRELFPFLYQKLNETENDKRIKTVQKLYALFDGKCEKMKLKSSKSGSTQQPD